MKVSGSQFKQLLKTYPNTRSEKVIGKEAVKNSDKVNLSPEAKEITRINEIIAQTPDLRIDKVAQLKSAIQRGTYEVKGDKIAEKMIERHLIDRVVK